MDPTPPEDFDALAPLDGFHALNLLRLWVERSVFIPILEDNIRHITRSIKQHPPETAEELEDIEIMIEQRQRIPDRV